MGRFVCDQHSYARPKGRHKRYTLWELSCQLHPGAHEPFNGSKVCASVFAFLLSFVKSGNFIHSLQKFTQSFF